MRQYVTFFLILTVSYIAIAYGNSASAGDTIVTRKGVKAFPDNQEIIAWQNALEAETRRFVDAGHNNLDDIINLVSEKTRELEQPALAAYINHCIAISGFGNELVRETLKEFLDPELEKTTHLISKQTTAIMYDGCRRHNEKNFSSRRNGLIEKYFRNIISSRQ